MQIKITDTTGFQLKLEYDASNYATLTTGSGGDLTIAPSGGDTAITGTLAVSSTFAVTGASTFTGAATARTAFYLDINEGLSAFPTSGNSLIYNTKGTGASYPFTEYGSVVLQPRPGTERDIVFVTGATPTVRTIISRGGILLHGTTVAGTTPAGGIVTPRTGGYYVVDAAGTGTNQVVGTRKTGWGAPTGTATRTAFATSTVTTAELAERVKAVIDDLTTHGLIGA
jgi:hypothetical protein